MSYPHQGQQGPPPRPPIADYLAVPRPGVSPDGQYVVLPRALLDQLPLHLQAHVANVLHHVHSVMSGASWPVYRVQPSRWAPVDELDESGLREAGLIAELTATGDLVYRDRANMRTLPPEEVATRHVLVSVPDPFSSGMPPRNPGQEMNS